MTVPVSGIFQQIHNVDISRFWGFPREHQSSRQLGPVYTLSIRTIHALIRNRFGPKVSEIGAIGTNSWVFYDPIHE